MPWVRMVYTTSSAPIASIWPLSTAICTPLHDEKEAGAAGPRRGHGKTENGRVIRGGRCVSGGYGLRDAGLCREFYPGGAAPGGALRP